MVLGVVVVSILTRNVQIVSEVNPKLASETYSLYNYLVIGHSDWFNIFKKTQIFCTMLHSGKRTTQLLIEVVTSNIILGV